MADLDAEPPPGGSEAAETQASESVWKWVIRLAPFVVVGAAFGVLVALGGDLAGAAGTWALKRAGFKDGAVAVSRFGVGGIDASFDFGNGTDRIETAALSYSVWGVLNHRFDDVRLRGVRLAAKLDADGTVHFSGRSFGGSGDVAELWLPPARFLGVADAFLHLETPKGAFDLPFELEARSTDEGVKVQLRLPRVELEGPIMAVTAAATIAHDRPLPFSIALAAAEGRAIVEIAGRHDPASGKGEATLDLKPVSFSDVGPKPSDMIPGFGENVTLVGGNLAAHGNVAWTGKDVTSSAVFLVKDVTATAGPVTVGGVNGVVRLSPLYPPVFPEGQTMSAALLDVGLPLTDGVIVFGGGDGTLEVSKANWRWAGGELSAAPFSINVQRPRGEIRLAATNVDLGKLLAAAAVGGPSATGPLRGILPVVLDGKWTRVENGAFESMGPGRITYDPVRMPQFLVGESDSAKEMLRGALTDFRYDSLRMAVEGRPGGETAIALEVQGANPNFYNGYPITLNLNLVGASNRNSRQNLGAYRVPDAVRDRMQEFERPSP